MAPAQIILHSSNSPSLNGQLSTKLTPFLANASLEDIASVLTPTICKASSPINGDRQKQIFFPPNFNVLSPIFDSQEPQSDLCQISSPRQTVLTGDGTKECLLPCTAFESTVRIKPSVLVQLLDGVYSKEVCNFNVFDCRYPYEYDGGHVSGAVNAPSFESLEGILTSQQQNKTNDGRREILIFHCEFSSQRAPSLLKQLRKADRDRNSEHYPRLDYPEIYLLEGGYKAFYEFCLAKNRLDLIDKTRSPQPSDGYVTMRDERFRNEERRWRRLVHSAPSNLETKLQEMPLAPIPTSDMTSPCPKAVKIIRRDRSLSTPSRRLARRLFDDDADLLSTSAPAESTPLTILLQVQPQSGKVDVAIVVENQKQKCHVQAANETAAALSAITVQEAC